MESIHQKSNISKVKLLSKGYFWYMIAVKASPQELNVNERQNLSEKWIYRQDNIKQSDSFIDSEKETILAGISKLRKTYTDDWILKVSKNGHPILSYLDNYAPASLFWLSDFGDKLDLIRNVVNFNNLVKRLKDTNELLEQRLK